MGLFDRISRVVKASFDALVSEAEDPERVLEQAVAEMQDELIQLRQAVAQAIATQKRTERQCNQANATATEWYRRAELALQAGDEALARDALTRRKRYQETAQIMQAQLDQQATIVQKLKRDMATLESKIADARTRKDLYIARARSAQASQRLHAMLDQMNPQGAMQSFERMERKVTELEARSAAITELGQDDLERRFAALEQASDIEADLATLKHRLHPGLESDMERSESRSES
ncbi:PspA/IM30 family protein [Trichothermofontia sp.]